MRSGHGRQGQARTGQAALSALLRKSGAHRPGDHRFDHHRFTARHPRRGSGLVPGRGVLILRRRLYERHPTLAPLLLLYYQLCLRLFCFQLL